MHKHRWCINAIGITCSQLLYFLLFWVLSLSFQCCISEFVANGACYSTSSGAAATNQTFTLSGEMNITSCPITYYGHKYDRFYVSMQTRISYFFHNHLLDVTCKKKSELRSHLDGVSVHFSVKVCSWSKRCGEYDKPQYCSVMHHQAVHKIAVITQSFFLNFGMWQVGIGAGK